MISSGSAVSRSGDASLGRKLGFLREYVAAIGVQKESIPKFNLSGSNFVLVNPKFSRFLSNEAPKKKSEFRLSPAFKKVFQYVLFLLLQLSAAVPRL